MVGKGHKTPRTSVLLIAPETGRLPESMGNLARYISGKSGGLGEVVSALCEGLHNRGIDCHLATLNLKKRFQSESRLDEESWQKIRYKVNPDKIHLVSSSIFSSIPDAYAGSPISTAAEFQKEVVNNVIKDVRAKSGGRIILHSHDWMAGGAITAYAKSRNCPVLHTVHNVHTGHIPLEMLFGVDLESFDREIYYSKENGKKCVDSQATAIKSATMVNLVGRRFLKEIIEDYFLDRPVVPASVRQEIKVKYHNGQTRAIINAPSLRLYPEQCEYIAQNYSPEDDVLAAKRNNLLEFQQRAGLQSDPQAILLYWPSRLDPVQKGIQLLEEIAQRFVNEHRDVQIAIIGNGVGSDRTHEEICGRIAWASGGRIVYFRHSDALSMLGFAAAHDVFGASLYEPCGQIDVIGNLYGATATNRDTGGYHDKIRELTLSGEGHDAGNGFLFWDYDAGGLWYGLHRSVEFHRRPADVRQGQLKRIMRETREKHSLERMISEYIALYKQVNNSLPLA